MRFATQSASIQVQPDFEPAKGQYVDVVREYTFSFADWLNRRGLTQNTITSEITDETLITIANESAANGVWQGEVTAIKPGVTNIVLTITTNEGDETEVGVIKLNLFDPEFT